MTVKKDQFFKKITRAAAEFTILSILAEKGVAHPYEIQELVQDELLKKYRFQIESIKSFIEISEAIISNFNDPKHQKQKDVNQILKGTKDPLFGHFGKIFLGKVKDNKDLLLDLEQLKEDAKSILIRRGSELKIWEHIHSIYQVIKELKERELIEEARTETIKGRTRKLYRITDRGRNEALKMIILFADLNQVIIPKALIFQDNLNILFQTHLDILFQIFNKIFPNKSIFDILHEIESSFPQVQKTFEGLFPLLDNDLLLISLLLEDFITSESINLAELSPNQQQLFKHLLLNHLKKHRKKLDDVIKNLE